MRRVILDTDVASLSIKQQLPSPLLRGLLGARVGVTFVTLGELTRWATLRQWAQSARRTRWLARHPSGAPLHRRGCRLWGAISAHATRRGRSRPHNDTWIAARCMAYDLPLATLNVKEFKDFAEHEGLTLIGI